MNLTQKIFTALYKPSNLILTDKEASLREATEE